ncbi:peptidase U32 family protein [Lentimicrobium sp. S6]|uniref:peptidase U32 family protein n=1 Tax=Lentimicrobium sp. S6 TaxID=2735872 RepID=UPI001552C0F0|nr:peptidase U32 family protein [Lentimicrobium sp. S6]NPD45131.1 U32 family peptidase [Lentimicrobium sp. S6]
MTLQPIELLAPGGDVTAIKAAILAGANAIYCGLDKFNARNRAANISLEDLKGLLHLAHQNDCKIFLTLNILILENEINSLISLLNKLVNTSIDGLIIQDIGLLYILKKHFPDFEIHASTQMTTHNKGQIQFLEKLGVKRVNLSREMNMEEIKPLTAFGIERGVSTEVFVHGSNCISFSGLCYMSSVQNGNSGNRGRCSQPCRDAYQITPAGKDYPLNMKDNSAYFDAKELIEAGVASVKIEGRIKKADYVFTVVDTWRKQIDSILKKQELIHDNSQLYKVFNRDFSNSYLSGNIGSEMFIDSPRDYSVLHLANKNQISSIAELEEASLLLYQEKDELKLAVEEQMRKLSIEKPELEIHISGEVNTPLHVQLIFEKDCIGLESSVLLKDYGKEPLSRDVIWKRFKTIEDTEYHLKDLDLSKLQNKTYLPYQDLTKLKKRILFYLNGNREWKEAIQIPKLNKSIEAPDLPSLSVIICSKEDAHLSQNKEVIVYFELPNCFEETAEKWVAFFKENESLIPYFPAVLIGREYEFAVEMLLQLKPKLILTNNTGIAFEAYKNDIPWIAGPSLNLVNSFSLLVLQKKFNAVGAFVSNELNKQQIQILKKQTGFKLFYSLFHPNILMTTRQCLFHQVTGCEKQIIDDSCLYHCSKMAKITNLKSSDYYIEKSEGNYHKIYDESHFLNLKIVNDIPHLFDGFSIDLKDINTQTKMEESKEMIIEQFQSLVKGEKEIVDELKSKYAPFSCFSYIKGI